MDGADDRISQLPEGILHCILSLLEPEEIARVACLSKSLLSAWLTYPNLTFNFYPDNPKKNQRLETYVDNTISRFSESKFSVHSVTLVVHSSPYRTYVSLISFMFWFPSLIIRFVVEKHVKILHVDCSKAQRSYSLPDTIFGAKSLIELKLRSCNLNNLFPDTKIEFNNITKVIFELVYLQDQWVLDKLFSNCPLIEEFLLCRCHLRFERLRVRNVPKLKRFTMWRNDCDLVEIDASSLELFNYSGDGTINLDACQIRKRLALATDSKTLRTSFSKFMYPEDLDLWKIDPWVESWESRNERVWREEPDTKWEVMIDAPNLLQLHYGGCRFNSLSFRNLPKELKINLDMPSKRNESPYASSWFMPSYVNESLSTWFLNLRKFLMERLNRPKIYLSLGVDDVQSCFEIQADSQELPKPEVEHLALNLFSRKINHQALVDGLFWSCHPTYISVQWHGVKPDCELIEHLWKNVTIRGGSVLNCFHNQLFDHNAKDGSSSGICISW